MSTKILSISFFLLFTVSQTISSPLTGQENGEEKLNLNPLLISKMDPVLQSHFKNKESNQPLILAVNQLEASLQNLYTVLDSQNAAMKKGANGKIKIFSRQDDEEEPELLVQIGQILGSIFSGSFRESIILGGRQAIKKRFGGLVQAEPTTKAPAKN